MKRTIVREKTIFYFLNKLQDDSYWMKVKGTPPGCVGLIDHTETDVRGKVKYCFLCRTVLILIPA